MKLTTGAIAPSFQTTDIFDNVINLDAWKGKPVLISFLRYSSCALCNLQVHKLIQKYPVYHQHGLEVLVVFESPIEKVRENVSKQDAPFALIADPQTRLYDLYGVESNETKVLSNISALTPKQQGLIQEAAAIGYQLSRRDDDNFFRLPADFLISSDHHIVEAYYSNVIGDHLSFDVLESYLMPEIKSAN